MIDNAMNYKQGFLPFNVLKATSAQLASGKFQLAVPKARAAYWYWNMQAVEMAIALSFTIYLSVSGTTYTADYSGSATYDVVTPRPLIPRMRTGGTYLSTIVPASPPTFPMHYSNSGSSGIIDVEAIVEALFFGTQVPGGTILSEDLSQYLMAIVVSGPDVLNAEVAPVDIQATTTADGTAASNFGGYFAGSQCGTFTLDGVSCPLYAPTGEWIAQVGPGGYPPANHEWDGSTIDVSCSITGTPIYGS